jgi:hypothetical protein
VDRALVQPQTPPLQHWSNQPIEFESRHHLNAKEAKETKEINEKDSANRTVADEYGLPTVCCAHVDKSSLATLKEPPTYPQAGLVDEPAPKCATISNYRESTLAL